MSGPEASGEKTALSIASHSGLRPARIGALAHAAELAGFSVVFVAEGHGDALSLCHPVAAATQAVRVGTAITNAALRPPVLAAKTAAQLDQAADGRFILGLGVANSVMNARFGIPSFAPLPMIEEYVGVVRAVLRGQAAGYDGRVFRTGVVPLDSPPVRADLPIYLAALGPRMLALAGRIADGVILGVDLRGVRELVLAGDRAGAAAQVPQQVADRFVAHGSAARCAARLADYRAAGVDLPVVFPMPVDGDWGYERTIAAMSQL